MALQEPEKPNISELASACKDLFTSYPTSCSTPFESQQSAERQRDRFSALEPDLAVFARSNTVPGSDEIHDLVMRQLFVLRTNLAFVAPHDESDISSFSKELQWVRRLQGTNSDAFNAIEAIIGRLEQLREIIRRLPTLNHESEPEDSTEKGTTRSDFASIKRVVKSNSPAALPSLQDHLAPPILERHRSEGRSLEQDEPNVSEAIDMPAERNPVPTSERDACGDMALKQSNNDNSSTPSSTRNLESCKSRQDICAEAETVPQKTMQLRFRSSSSERPESLSSMAKTATEPPEQRKYQEPEEEGCKAPELHANALRASSLCNIPIMGSQANVLVGQGNIEDAEKIYREILDLSTELLGEEHPHRLSCRSNLASILEKRGEYAEAEAVYRDVWEIQRRKRGDSDADTLTSYNKLANALTRLKRFDEAVLIYEETLEKRRMLCNFHSDTVITLGNLANSLQNKGQYGAAKEKYKEAEELGKDVLEGDHRHLRWIRARLNDAEEW